MMKAFMFLKYSQISMSRNLSLKTAISTFKFSTKNNNKISLNKFNSIIKRNFTEETTREKTVYLNEQEAYTLNEHDRMLIQLNSNVVPTSSLPKFIKELTGYCFTLSKYKNYIKGWKYVGNFVHENLKNFTNEDLEYYVTIFSLTKFLGETPNFWKDISQEVMKRNLTKESLLNVLVNFTSVHQFLPNELWNEIVRKLESLGLSEYSEYIKLAAYLGIVNYTKEDPIWENILSFVENKEIQLKDIPVTFLIRAANALKSKLSRDSPFYEKVRIHLTNNFQSTPGEYVAVLCDEFTKFAPPSESDLISLIIQSLALLSDATQKIKLDFAMLVLRWCRDHKGLRNLLEQNKSNLGNFVVPTDELIKDFESYQSQLASYRHDELDKLVQVHEKFWLNNAEKIGFRVGFAQNYSTYGPTDYNSLEETHQKLKAQV